MYSNGTYYEGEWLGGSRDGKGKLWTTGKDMYEENGKMIKLMGMGFIYKKTGLNMKDIGRMIYKMDLERKFGLIILNMKACIRKGKSTVMDNLYFQIQQCITEIDSTTKWKEKEHI